MHFAIRFTRLIALAASLILLASNFDNIPDCPELLNYGPQKVTCVITHHHPIPVLIVLGRTAWQIAPRGDDRVLYIGDSTRATSPYIARIAQHATDPSPPTTLV